MTYQLSAISFSTFSCLYYLFHPVLQLASFEHHAPATGHALQADIRAQTHHPPFVASAGFFYKTVTSIGWNKQ